MGTQADGTVTVGGQRVNVRADFASDHVTFSGGRRGEVPYSAIEVVGTGGGILRLRVDGAPMQFELGNAAERIAAKIRKPPSLVEKLGLKAGQSCALLSVPQSLVSAVREVLPRAMVGRSQGADVVFFGVASAEELAGLEDAARSVAPGGALWVVYPKGKQQTIRERDVLDAGHALGLKDTRVARISPTHTALRFAVQADAAQGSGPG